jgi:CRISPR/Cas system-associated exonuclease Cas4 (RecB family)
MTVAHVPVTARQEAALCKARTWLSLIADERQDSAVADVANEIADLIHTIRLLAPVREAAMEPWRQWARDHEIDLQQMVEDAG